ncbi:unnamed protein product [Blepharisma stoltei]|uniref:DNA-directed DNA polymerase family A palm domain-containing protein n=1 Tax=Blepharisma stoltei TaxID=1481888 RepID=A0AAU9INR1_9CILI|nr:unnamed protein product [Blepharisma stoltei]
MAATRIFRSIAHNPAFENLKIPGITIVRTKDQAKRVVEILMSHPERIHAWDTETIGFDVKEQSPVGNGQIICATAFIGPEVNFGSGSKLFIDNYAEANGIIEEFKPYFENPDYYKVWHNYGFDRHIFYNHGINVLGFGGDTMHMARLANPSRGPKEYSLARCTHNYSQLMTKVKNKLIKDLINFNTKDPEVLKTIKEYTANTKMRVKKTMDELFAYQKPLKSGGLSKLLVTPEVEELHTTPQYIEKWVDYSTLDAELTFYLREALVTELSSFPLKSEDMTTLWDFYLKYWLPLGETLTDMERNGMKLDLQHMKKINDQANNDKFKYKNEFLSWVNSVDPDLLYFNPDSNAHMQQFLYAPFNKEQGEANSDSEGEEEEVRKTSNMSLKNQMYFPKERTFLVENLDRKDGEKKMTHMTIKGLGLPVPFRTISGMPSVDGKALRLLAGDPSNGKHGIAYEFFKNQGDEKAGISICYALDSLLKYKGIDTLLHTYIEPLQTLCDKEERIHYSLNINTETGRLSAKKPNAQNQPALDKDIYKIRKAFIASTGNCLIVADYGQLELRVLAHMTNCQSMINAFHAGGDFHSRTAISMYPEIKQAVDEGKVLLEWDKSQGEPPAPLLKSLYAAQRKTAKTMNFSIAYGKTAHGFAKDWGCSLEEASEALKRWYAERKEVEDWQDQVRKLVRSKGYTRTLLGRYRKLTEVNNKLPSKKQHALRAAINTPIQGGAADIVTGAMIRINYNDELKQMGWKLLVQIHDEVILEGPSSSADRAFEIVKECMSMPLDEPLRINLETDAKIAQNWYDAK